MSIAVSNTIKMFSQWSALELRCQLSRIHRPKVNYQPKKVALLSFKLPPQFDSGTHRPLSFLRYAQENNWHIDALTNQPNKPISAGGQQLLTLVPKTVEIDTFENFLVPTSFKITPNIDGGFTNALALTKKAIARYQQTPPEVILASGPPFCYFVAGYFLSKITGRPLVLDYRDEWTLCPFDFASKGRLNSWFEKRCIKQASKILYTTESHLLAHQQHFSIPINKQALVFNGWEDDALEAAEPSTTSVEKDNNVHIAYIGRLSGHVDLAPFLKDLGKAAQQLINEGKSVSVEFIGEKTDKQRDCLQALIEQNTSPLTILSQPQVSKPEALRLMHQADLVLMLCNKDLASYIPGKLYDYLSTGTAVLAYGYSGEVSQILTQFQAGHFIEEGDHQQLAKMLLGSIPDLRNNTELQQWLSSRTRRSQAQNMYTLLNQLGDVTH